MTLTQAQVRRLALTCQGLDGRWGLPAGKEGAAQVVERLGYVQIDTIAVVERAHPHTLWTRCPGYAPAMLEELLAHDRRVFEYWGHAASYLPMRDYRFYLPRMNGYAASEGARAWVKQNKKLVKHVVDRIRDEGPLRAADFEAPKGRRGSWWDWKPAKRALETLFNSGELMVTERRNFQRVYELRERVLPAEVDTTLPGPEERTRSALHKALAPGGLLLDLSNWRLGTGSDPARDALGRMVAAGEVTQFRVQGRDEPGFVLTESLAATSRRSKQLHLLSPFDNLIIDRRRTQRLFGFDFKLECYTPEAKRRWGYFCLPLLWGSDLLGRLDPKADRKAKTLIVRKLLFEPDFTDFDRVLPALAKKLKEFAAFNACESVVLEKSEPKQVKAPLKRELKT